MNDCAACNQEAKTLVVVLVMELMTEHFYACAHYTLDLTLVQFCTGLNALRDHVSLRRFA